MTHADPDPTPTDDLLNEGRSDMDPEPGLEPDDETTPMGDDADVDDTGTDGESTGTPATDEPDDTLAADEDAVPAPDEPLR